MARPKGMRKVSGYWYRPDELVNGEPTLEAMAARIEALKPLRAAESSEKGKGVSTQGKRKKTQEKPLQQGSEPNTEQKEEPPVLVQRSFPTHSGEEISDIEEKTGLVHSGNVNLGWTKVPVFLQKNHGYDKIVNMLEKASGEEA
jgi:hypothetical protein